MVICWDALCEIGLRCLPLVSALVLAWVINRVDKERDEDGDSNH